MIKIAHIQRGDDDASDFSPTLPPPTGFEPPLPPDAEVLPPPHEVARVLVPLGLKGLCASMFDVDSMACLSSWALGDAGQRDTFADEAGGASFPTAMATLVHLHRTPFDQTLTRQLDPQRWAFAWRVDEHRVAVAEARYRLPGSGRSERDISVVRQLCGAGIGADQFQRAEAVNERFEAPTSSTATPASPPPASPKSTLPNKVDQWARPLRWPAVMALGLASAICLASALLIASSRTGEAQRLRQLTDATMTEQLARVLATGDYGEVQANLEVFEGLGYFKGSAVIDARRRVVASAGALPALRIGLSVSGPDAVNARAVPLKAATGKAEGQLLIWGPEMAALKADALIDRALFAAALVLALTTAAGAALLWRQRSLRRETEWREADQRVLLLPLPDATAPS